MSIATGATRAEINTLYKDVVQLEIMLRQIVDGSGRTTAPGRFTVAQVNAQIAAVQNAASAALAV